MSFNELLSKSYHKKEDASPITHTRIGSKSTTNGDSSIRGGSYYISDEQKDRFYKLYVEHVFELNNKEYLTEVQNKEKGPILIDLDFRYDPVIDKRQHTENDIIAVVGVYLDALKEIVEFNDNTFQIYVFEKPEVNRTNTSMTKDGIHIYIGITLDRCAQVYLRELVLKEITKSVEIPVLNSWEQVIDEGICAGYTNWQLYGSRKPGHTSYMLKYIYDCKMDMNDREFSIENIPVEKFDIMNIKNFKKLTAQYNGHIEFPIKEDVMGNLNKHGIKTGGVVDKKKRTLKIKYNTNIIAPSLFSDIKTPEKLNALIEKIMSSLNSNEYYIKETHDFTMILPEEYYGPGSYNKWIRVGWALKATDERLFLTWVKFSSQENCRKTLRDSKNEKFDFNTIPYLYELWCGFSSDNEETLTRLSIIYWAKTDSKPSEFKRVQKETVDYYVELTIATNGATEYDIANVLYKLFQEQFVCVNIKNNIWYEFKNHRWSEIDSGCYLRTLISTDVHNIYRDKISQAVNDMNSFTEDDPRWKKYRTRTHTLANIAIILKSTAKKSNIMKEAKDLFYDPDFVKKENQNPYLLCFKNGVFDFSINKFRDGRPDDYLTKCTNNDYVPIDKVTDTDIREVKEFMRQIYPEEELHNYMWQHFASTLLGLNLNQTFNIYTGSGANGKSVLVDLMSNVLGEYKGDVPITLVTQKRCGIGAASPEISMLKDIRYAVMQEPSKGDVINEGIMKQLTGDDPLTGRGLFKDPVTFIPQFKLAVCTNNLFGFRSNDDGTWRRIRLCPHKAKFTDDPVEGDEDEPYQYKKDKNIKRNFVRWKTAMMALLVEIAKVKKGLVEDCECVLEASNNYRNTQDYISQFIKTRIQKCDGEKIKKTELYETFKQWYNEEYGKNVPKGKELYDYMEKKYGKYVRCWKGVRIVYDDDNINENDNNSENSNT
jgi:P4 family phage/plasmid primase-like protien